MASKFTHLHVHSHYSLLDGLPKVDLLLDRVEELGMDSVAITDHGNLYAAIEFYKKAKARGIKPILGAEIYLAFEDMKLKRPGVDDESFHMVVLAKNKAGYENLVKILTAAHLDGYYYRPRVDETFLAEHSEGLIALSACLSGRIPSQIIDGDMQEATATALRYQKIFGEGNFYLEIQNHPGISDQAVANQGLLAISRSTGIPLVATADSHYLRPEDAEAQDILMLVSTGARANDPERLSLKQDDFSLKSEEEMEQLFAETPDAFTNTKVISDACNVELDLNIIRLPAYPLPSGKTADEYLRELCTEGLKEKPEVAQHPEAQERIDYELDVIKDTGYASYFLIVQDFVNWAKAKRIVVGPGRGSAGGSLVSYLLKITNVDPLKHGLIFERFLDKERNEMPDIDIDFADNRRDEVIEYVAEKYGRDCVAQIITFGTMAARAVIRDVGRALGYEYGYCDKLAKLIPFGYDLEKTLKEIGEFKELYEREEDAKKIIDLGKKLEGVARHASTHACGVVIAAESLNTLVPLQHPSQNDKNIVTQYEMNSIKDMGLLKMDFLGLSNLSTIEETLKRIYAIYGKSIDLEDIPYDDDKAYKLLRDGNTTGLFQIESSGMRRYLKELKPTAFEDIIAMIALYRPGPMELIPDFINRKHGRTQITYLHPKLEPILKNTYGIAVYQEQVLQIARDIAGFTYSEADVLRKAIGKKIRDLLDEQKEKFITGALNNGVDKKTAEKLFQFVEPFARYGFNKSHSAAYAMISYQTAWLKANYPVEFMSSLLTSDHNDIERIAFLIEETRKMDIEVLPPDTNESFSQFSVVPEKNQIRFGLTAIKNVGEGIVEAIIDERKANGKFESIQDFITRVKTKDLNRKSMESMIKSGAFDQFEERNLLLHNLERLLEISRENHKLASSSQQSLFRGEENAVRILLEEAEEATERERLSWEKELLGLYVSSHPLEGVKNVLSEKAFSIQRISSQDDESSQEDGKFYFAASGQGKVRIGGIISSVKRIITKNGKHMLFMNLEDLTDKIEVVVFPTVLDKHPTAFVEDKIVLIGGKLDMRNGERKFIADDIEELIVV